jgi:RNA polymerase sigma factor (sigma-70 family)
MSGDGGRTREVAVDPKVFERIAEDAALWRGVAPRGDAPERQGERDGLRADAIAMLAAVIETRLTPRQREIVDLYFYQRKTQAEIAVVLGISQQVVSKQLFGAMRKGRRVGGAIRKLRKLLQESGIEFE